MRYGSPDVLRIASDSIDVVAGLLKAFPDIAFVDLAELSVPPAATSKRLMRDPALRELNEEALDLRDKYQIPFWIAVASVAQSRRVSLTKELLQASAFHQPMAAVRVDRIAADSITSEYLRERCASLSPGKILTLSSQVLLNNGTTAHIPMLDFRIATSGANLPTVLATLTELGHAGIVLDSGQSYHFYGFALLSADELRQFLGKALLFTPLVDYRWVAHQLIEGACALRLSQGASKQKIPTTVTTIGYEPG